MRRPILLLLSLALLLGLGGCMPYVRQTPAEVDGVRYPACVNIGVHPTVGALPAPLLEANLIGFAGDLYGKELAVWLQAHLRGEMRFESAAALRARVLYDRQLVADYYQK